MTTLACVARTVGVKFREAVSGVISSHLVTAGRTTMRAHSGDRLAEYDLHGARGRGAEAPLPAPPVSDHPRANPTLLLGLGHRPVEGPVDNVDHTIGRSDINIDDVDDLAVAILDADVLAINEDGPFLTRQGLNLLAVEGHHVSRGERLPGTTW